MNNHRHPGFGRLARNLAVFVVIAFCLAGCATSGNPRDPLESVNRAVFSFNDGFDRAVAKPLAEGYRAAMPSFARTAVTNFFSNLEDLWIALNDLLQGKPRKAVDDLARTLINTTIGIFGLFDVASDIGIEKRNEDFGQTLGRWGVASGPYLVLPFLGPSTLRDALGYGLFDTKADLVMRHSDVSERNTAFVLRVINLRANLLDASRIVEEAALDKYTFMRDAYLQRRQNLVYDGNPPKDDRAASEEESQDAVLADRGEAEDGDKQTADSVNADRPLTIVGMPAKSGMQ